MKSQRKNYQREVELRQHKSNTVDGRPNQDHPIISQVVVVAVGGVVPHVGGEVGVVVGVAEVCREDESSNDTGLTT